MRKIQGNHKGYRFEETPKRKYAQPTSFYPLNPDVFISSFMEVGPEKIIPTKSKTEKKHQYA